MHGRGAPRGWERLNEVEVEVLRPTRRKIGHHGDVFPSQSLAVVAKRMGEMVTCPYVIGFLNDVRSTVAFAPSPSGVRVRDRAV